MKYMHVLFTIMYLFFFCQCKNENTINYQVINAEVGKTFTVKKENVVTFEELDLIIEVKDFSNYIINGVLPPNSTMTGVLKSNLDDFEFTLQHFQQVEETGEQVYFDNKPDDKHFIEEAILSDNYKLVFEKLYWLDPNADEVEILEADLVLLKR